LKQLLVAGIAVAAIGVMPAVAADLSPDPLADFPIVYQPPLVRTHSWTGCYLGVQVGAADGTDQFNGQFFDNVIPGAPATAVTISTNSIGVDQFGALAGGQVGCDVEFVPRWVIGAAADAAAANISGNTAQNLSLGLPNLSTFNSTGQLNSQSNFVATATGRIGYSPSEFAGQGLFYAKGGGAWVHNQYSFNGQVSTTPAGLPTVFTPFNFNDAETRMGWTVGVGLEWVIFGRWSFMAEYDYMNFGNRNSTFTGAVIFPANTANAESVNVNVSQYLNEFKVGINYRFF
jgi:outer membrane immunogenic protein